MDNRIAEARKLAVLPAPMASEVQQQVLRDAMKRADGNVCPTYGLRGATQRTVLRALEKQGYIVRNPDFPHVWIISEQGRKAIT